MERTTHMLTRLKKKMTHQKIKGRYLFFRGSEENFVRNGAWVLEESITLFHGKANPVRYLSVDDLNNMNVEPLPCYEKVLSNLYQGSWEGRVVLVMKSDIVSSSRAEYLLREIVIAAQMVTHKNAHKILGCCLETFVPVLVYEWMPPETLRDRIFVNNKNQSKAVLELKDRLRIAWEISHVVAYLHTAFARPIIHTDLNPSNVFLDQDNAVKLVDFGCSVSIPEGEESVEQGSSFGTMGFEAPERIIWRMVSKSTNVYSFGRLFLELLTGKRSLETNITDEGKSYIKNNCVNEIVDPAITRNGVTTIEDLQLKASVQLALRCVTEEADYRPTMVEVATELKKIFTSPESIPSTINFQKTGLYWIFHGSEENFMHNEARVLKESFSLFHESARPLRYFSVHELNNMNVELDQLFQYCCHQGTWKGKAVLVKRSSYSDMTRRRCEIVVATQMVTHNNVQKLLGCCLETELPVLVYEWVAAETLKDRILRNDENNSKLPPLKWMDRLRIAWEIANVVSYLHTALPKPIIHGSLKLNNILLDQDNTVKLSNFFYSAPNGENASWTRSPCWTRSSCYSAPEYYCRALAECTDVYSFGMLFLELLTGKKTFFLSSTGGEQYNEWSNSVDWITKKVRLGHINEIVDPAIAKSGVATTELSASIELALRCTTSLLNSWPTMVDIATELNNIIRSHESIPSTSTFQGEGMYMIFRGSKEYYMQNESFIDEENNSLFPGRTKPIRYFSADELCKMKVEYHRMLWNRDCNWHQGSWEGNVVLVKLSERAASDEIRMRILREILVATQMASHRNVQKLIGCCLETEYPVLVYESVAEETLEDRVSLKDENQTKPELEWKERLRIAWEISQVVSHLHNDFSRPIIHGYLETDNIFLDLDNTVKLSDFSRCISIPEGQNFVEDFGGYSDYKEKDEQNRVAECSQCTDVYSFGVLFLVLLTGKSAYRVNKEFRKIPSSKIVVDPAVAKNGVVTAEMAASIKLALRCLRKRDKRPTMLQVATKLEKIIKSYGLPNNGFSLLRGCLTS